MESPPLGMTVWGYWDDAIMIQLEDRISGVLLGTAVGDAIGLPREGLSKRRAARLFGGHPLKHSFLPGKGMCSDDTEHTCMVMQALVHSGGDVTQFQQLLAWKLRFWLLGIPAGVGLATLKSICKLWVGFGPSKSGVYSAGNGPAMRSAILGVYANYDTALLKNLTHASSRITHTDERATQGALIIALAAQYACTRSPSEIIAKELFDLLHCHITDSELCVMLDKTAAALDKGLNCNAFADEIGLSKGVSGYIIHTIPAALFCWLKNLHDFRSAIEDVVLLGGDTDTTGAITGALAGATLGASGIPTEWIEGIAEWPRSTSWMRHLSERLANGMNGKTENKPLPLFWPGILVRNAFFTVIVLLHGLRRLLPPY